MKSVNMHEAKTQLSRLVEEAELTGEVFVICRNGNPVAELRALAACPDPLAVDPGLAVVFHEDPASPLEPEDWPGAFQE